MGKEIFDDCNEFAEVLYELSLGSVEEVRIGVVADGRLCAEILRALIAIDAEEDPVFTIEELDLDGNSEFPYYICIDRDFGLWCQPAIVGDEPKMIMLDDDIIYIQSGYMNKARGKIANEDAEVGEFVIGPEEEESDFNLIRNFKGEICGFIYDSLTENPSIHLSYCRCEPLMLSELVEKHNGFMDIITELMS